MSCIPIVFLKGGLRPRQLSGNLDLCIFPFGSKAAQFTQSNLRCVVAFGGVCEFDAVVVNAVFVFGIEYICNNCFVVVLANFFFYNLHFGFLFFIRSWNV